MMRQIVIVMALLNFVFHIGDLWAIGLPEAKITIKVIDELGTPVESARVGIGFEKNTGWGIEEIPVVGFTAENGLFSGGANSNNYIGFNVTKAGYYKGTGNYTFKEKKSGRWEPWNPEVRIVLRKIENPVPMFARNMRRSGSIKISIIGKEVGFDLIEYDWVEPFGKGKHKDFIFKLDTTVKSQDEYEGTLTLTFPNKFDGILLVKEDRKYGSSLKLPRHAPENGYQKKLKKYNRSLLGKPYEEDYKEDNNYIFRIRSEEKDGKLVRAMYGKIHGDIRFGVREPGVNFTYYLNPDYTKNLEFDPKQNLFKNLKYEAIGSGLHIPQI